MLWAHHMESRQAFTERCQDEQEHQDPHASMWRNILRVFRQMEVLLIMQLTNA
jgi:hypothetical protein